jgi:hypothetical protein
VRSRTRREFLGDSGRLLAAGSASFALGSLLTGCGSGSNGALTDDIQIVQRFPQNLVTGPVRLPISLASNGGLLTASDETPRELSARVERIDGGRDEVVIDNVTATRHDAGISTPYWPFTLSVSTAGFYRLVLDGGPQDGAAFQVFERGEIAVPSVGDRLTPFDTPTFDDARGVDPICTRQPEPCRLHDITLREALTSGVAVALLVGTPAHCSTGTCAPALDALLSLAERDETGVRFIHAEVYADPNATKIAPVVSALAMNYEPALFLTDESGVVTARLDAVFDEVELRTVIDGR